MTDLADLLAPFKANESLSPIVALVDDTLAMQVLVVWPYVPKDWAEPTSGFPSDSNARWAWLWEGCQFSAHDYARMVDVGVSTLQRKLEKLRGARLMFPDGSIDARAESFVRNHIARGIK